ncbi:MAG TPA: glycosyltransferase 87 family protein [Terracidiphilus sp.]|jgi:hypothetical protein|nr:glycosyltransferase 87 family protein [Terracidiphilus sp.]
MKKTRAMGPLLILLSCGVSVFWGVALGKGLADGTPNYRAIYYGARCLIHHTDPYREGEFLRVYQAEGGEFPSDPGRKRLFVRSVPICVNLPTTLFLVAPLAFLPWGVSHALWLILMAASFALAAFLAWDLARARAPGIALFLICILLVNSEVLFALGNSAGIAVSLCVVAVWCFFREHLVWVGVLCLAVSLALKPHDSGLVWLYLLLAGGALRRRALYTLAATLVLAVPAVIWVSHAAPHWNQELRANLAATSAHGDISDPGPDSISRTGTADILIDLQTVISVFRDDPGFYNPAAWSLCGCLLIVWGATVIRSLPSAENAWYALAAAAPLTMLATYHRPYDAKLLLLAIPACALLWAEGSRRGRVALLVTGLAIALTGDIPLAILSFITQRLKLSEMSTTAKLLSIFVVRPAPLILLVMAGFYLWLYLGQAGSRVEARAHPEEARITQA